MSSLLGRFKEKYESGSDFKVSWSNLDKEENLTVEIVDKKGNEKFCPYIEEFNGEIIWY
ncbi:hypothetical protein ACQPUZ_09025 [Clostridium tertium]